MNAYRLFIGLALPDKVSALLAARMESMAGRLPFSRWTHPADLHVTLLFLGETPVERLEEVRRIVRETAASAAPIALELAEPGTFGPPSAPRVLWCGVAERPGGGTGDGPAQGALSALYADLCSRAAAAGFRTDPRPFRPHVTLARGGNAACSPAAVATAWREAVSAGPTSASLPASPTGAGASFTTGPAGASLPASPAGIPGAAGPAAAPPSAGAASSSRGHAGGAVWTADRLTLFRSHLGRRPSYERIAEYRFGR